MVWFILSGIGIGAGVLSGMFGIGGGLVIVPALLLAMNMPIQTAAPVSLVALLLPVGAFAVYAYYQSGRLTSEHIFYGLMIALGMFLGAFFGARMAISMNPVILRKAFAVFLVFAAVLTWFKK